MGELRLTESYWPNYIASCIIIMPSQSPVQGEENPANHGEAEANPANHGEANPGRDVGRGNHKRAQRRQLGANSQYRPLQASAMTSHGQSLFWWPYLMNVSIIDLLQNRSDPSGVVPRKASWDCIGKSFGFDFPSEFTTPSSRRNTVLVLLNM